MKTVSDIYFATGKVGIGLSAPAAKLGIKSNGTGVGVALLVEDSSDADIFELLDNGRITIPYIYNNTNASAANVYVDSNGRLLRSTASSKRFKKNIDYDGVSGNEILDLKPVRHRYKKSHHKDDKTRFFGFIAEDLADKYPELVSWDKGKPSDVNYPKITVLLTKTVQNQQSEIDRLSNENSELKKRLEKIEQILKI